MSVRIDRSNYRVRKISLEEEGRDCDLANLTPSERVALVWPLTVQAWTFKDGKWDESRLRRDVVRTQRNWRWFYDRRSARWPLMESLVQQAIWTFGYGLLQTTLIGFSALWSNLVHLSQISPPKIFPIQILCFKLGSLLHGLMYWLQLLVWFRWGVEE